MKTIIRSSFARGYIQHVTNMFKLMGDDDATAAAEAKAVMDIETTLAKASTKREDLRNPEATITS